MFDLFGIKKLKMTKQELEQSNAQLNQRLSMLNDENKSLIVRLRMAEGQIKAMSSNVSSLVEQLKKQTSNEQKNKYSDDSKYY
jgi:predicted negative regulator of RcsB-dependent stress response